MKPKRPSARPAVEIREYTVVPAKELFPLRRKMLRHIVAALNKRTKSPPRNPSPS
jgi:hypothetical protein